MPKLTRVVAGQALGIALAAAAVWGVTRVLPVVEWISAAQQRIVGMQYGGALLYPLLCAGCNLLLLPGGILAVGAGLFFGLWWGTFLVLCGNLMAAAAAFLISRKLGRGWLERKLSGRPRWQALDAAIRRKGGKIIFLSQVHPLFPTSLLNYLYGVTSIRFSTCLFWVALGQLPGIFFYAYLGTLAQLGLKLAQGRTHPATHEYGLWLGGLAVTLVISAALGQVALQILAEVQREARAAEPAPATEDRGGPGLLARLRKALTRGGSMLA